MNVLIAKLGATGDVVRTTPLLRRFKAQVIWLTSAKNAVLLQGLLDNVQCVAWEECDKVPKSNYDLAINLEDTLDIAQFVQSLKPRQIFGAYAAGGDLKYSDDSKGWFDLSLISRHGRKEADMLKLKNRRTYQDLIFAGLGLGFKNEPYLLPVPPETDLAGDVALAQESGPVWPMKNWAFYDQLKKELESRGLTVNVLPKRPTMLEHLADVRNHRCLVGGDSLPMHFALGTGRRCVTLFNCTSPWEIHDYGLQKKIVSPLLEEFFYKRDFDRRATTAITLEEVLDAVMENIMQSTQARR